MEARNPFLHRSANGSTESIVPQERKWKHGRYRQVERDFVGYIFRTGKLEPFSISSRLTAMGSLLIPGAQLAAQTSCI
jgi:hypothetical protein